MNRLLKLFDQERVNNARLDRQNARSESKRNLCEVIRSSNRMSDSSSSVEGRTA